MINRWKPTAWLSGWKSCKWSLFFPSNIYLFLVALADSRFRVDTSYFKTTSSQEASIQALQAPTFHTSPCYGQYGIQHRTSSSTFTNFSMFSLLKFLFTTLRAKRATSFPRPFGPLLLLSNFFRFAPLKLSYTTMRAKRATSFPRPFGRRSNLVNKRKRLILGISGSFAQ